MIRIAVIDDEEIAIEKINKIIKKYLNKLNIKSQIKLYTNPTKFLSDVFKFKFQILFIDLDMPILSGFDISEKIRETNKDLPIIFITNRNDLVYQAFRYKALGFIRKEYIDIELPDALFMVLKEIDMYSNEISITYSGRLYKICIDDIVYIQIENHYAFLHTQKQGVFKTRSTLTSYSESIEFANFIPISSNCLVNFSYIFSIEKECILLKNNEKLYMSRRRINEVKDKFLRLSRGALL